MEQTITITKAEHELLLSKLDLANKLEKKEQELLIKTQELLVENTELLKQIEIFKAKILDLQKRLFGKKKDQITNKKSSNIGKRSTISKGEKAGRKPIDKSRVDITQHYDFAAPPICDGCNNLMANIGSNDSYHEDYKVEIKKIKISKAKYVCRDCNLIKVATGPRLPIRKGLPMPGFLAQIVLDKFSNGLPLYRQAQMYGYSDHSYTRQMFTNWTMIVGELLSPIHTLNLLNMLQQRYLASDETGIVLLHMPGKRTSGKGYICVLKQFGGNFNLVYCWVIRSRKQAEINDILKDFKGYVQTDGLNFYSKLENIDGIILVKCWAHTRRKFVEVVNLSGATQTGIAAYVVEQIDLLYEIEKQAKNNNFGVEEIRALRQEKSQPILNRLKSYLQENIKTTPPKSNLGKAINYALKNWEGLTIYLTDGKLDIDNNHTERCIKYIVMGRKAWLFSDNIDSANKLAAIYSLIVSCKINNINPKIYLEYVLTQMPYINKNNIKELEQMLPNKFDITKRFDQEFLESNNIIEKLIYHDNNQITAANHNQCNKAVN